MVAGRRCRACKRSCLSINTQPVLPAPNPILQTARSFVAVELQSKDAQKKRVQLERLLGRFEVPTDGSKAALMHMLLAAGASAEEAYAVGGKYGSLLGLLEAVER